MTALGRFAQADTIVPQALNPQDLNRYSYVRNNPLRYVDPGGHCGTICSGFIGAGASLAVDIVWQVAFDQRALSDYDFGSTAGATVEGFIFGATLGRVPAKGMLQKLVAVL